MPGLKKKTQSQPPVLDIAWEGATGDCVECLAASPDGGLLAGASIDGNLFLFKSDSGHPVLRVKAHSQGCSSLAWHPGGEALASGGQDGKVRIWSREGAEIRCLSLEGREWVGKVAWDPKGAYLAFAAGRKVGFWHRETDALSFSVSVTSTVTDLAWNPEGGEVAASCYGGVSLFRPGHPDPSKVYPWKGSSLALAWSPAGKYLAAGQQDQEVHLWETATGKDMHMHGYAFKVRELSWNLSGRYLATGGSDTVTVWDCSGKGPSGSRPLDLQGHEARITCLAFHPAAKNILASGGGDARLALWDLDRGRIAATAMADGVVSCIAWQGPRIAVGDEEGRVLVFKAPF